MTEQYESLDGRTPALNKALAAVQKELPSVHAGQTANAGSFSYSYADLADINPKIMPLLGKNGLSWVTRPTWENDRFFLRYELRHESGEMIDGLYPLRGNGGPQDVGKEITYARRYALCAVTGLAAGGDDDDGASAQQAAKTQPAKRAPAAVRTRQDDTADAMRTAAQRMKYHAMRGQLGWDEDQGHDFIEGLSNGRFTRWSDLDARGRGLVLDAMGEQIRGLPREKPPEDGPMFPDGVDPKTGEVDT